MKILNILGSSRKEGNSEILSEQALSDLQYKKVCLAEKNIKPVVDKRHSKEGYSIVLDDYEELLTDLFNHDIYIFTTPLYWYGMTGPMKNFFDRWSQYLRDERFDFKAEMSKKKAYVIVTAGANPKIEALPLIQQFEYIFKFVNMEFVDYILGQGNLPGDVRVDKAAMSKALLWNQTFSS
ncbi:flavodoxin family protein [Chengkuizengella axinellae]|uniref:Flavodoxin family protein n=1 Tax=Chengkuizengella axinellae TaxID=3064388 RepID=A0ABT9IX64_9BACL|nr:flavodoxin family protein [Chengkuizengella sp. 2205SS18-9]MDP5273920.1 flavodoxin family protein [Chengkuizengella sp. 2205SS18-9]